MQDKNPRRDGAALQLIGSRENAPPPPPPPMMRAERPQLFGVASAAVVVAVAGALFYAGAELPAALRRQDAALYEDRCRDLAENIMSTHVTREFPPRNWLQTVVDGVEHFAVDDLDDYWFPRANASAGRRAFVEALPLEHHGYLFNFGLQTAADLPPLNGATTLGIAPLVGDAGRWEESWGAAIRDLELVVDPAAAATQTTYGDGYVLAPPAARRLEGRTRIGGLSAGLAAYDANASTDKAWGDDDAAWDDGAAWTWDDGDAWASADVRLPITYAWTYGPRGPVADESVYGADIASLLDGAALERLLTNKLETESNYASVGEPRYVVFPLFAGKLGTLRVCAMGIVLTPTSTAIEDVGAALSSARAESLSVEYFRNVLGAKSGKKRVSLGVVELAAAVAPRGALSRRRLETTVSLELGPLDIVRAIDVTCARDDEPLCGLLGFADLLRCLAFGDAALVLVFGLIIAFMGKAARNETPGDVELAGPGGGAAPTTS